MNNNTSSRQQPPYYSSSSNGGANTATKRNAKQPHYYQCFRVLYTNQKTKKRKLWKDGKLTFHNAGKQCRLYEAYPLPGTASGGAIIDELDLCGGRQQQVVGDELESDKYLIRIEGPWEDEVDGRSAGTGSIANNVSAAVHSNRSGGRLLGNSGAGRGTLGSTTTSSAATVGAVARSDGMKKLLSSKYRMPPKVMPLHPEERRRRDNSLIGGGNVRNQRKMPPLQPGELERRYYGGGGGGEEESFEYDTERQRNEERRGAGESSDGGSYGSYNNGNGNSYGESVVARQGGEDNRGISGYNYHKRLVNYDDAQRPTQSKACDYNGGGIGGASSHNTNLGNDVPSRNNHCPSLNNEDVVGGIDHRDPGSRQPIHDERRGYVRHQWNQLDRQPSNTPTFPPTQRSNHYHVNKEVSSNSMGKENDSCKIASKSFIDRGRGGGCSGHDSVNIGNATSRFISDGYDASGLYEEEESDSDNDDDEHDDIGCRNTVGRRVDERDTSSDTGYGFAAAFQDGCIDSTDNRVSGNSRNRNDRQQEDASSDFHHQSTLTSVVPIDDQHATDELLELLGVAGNEAAPATILHPSEDEMIDIVMERCATYRPKNLVSTGRNIDNDNDSTIKAVGFDQNDVNRDRESSLLAGIIEAENQLQDRSFDTWPHRNNDWDENSDRHNEDTSDENEAFSSGQSNDVVGANSGLHWNDVQDEKEMDTANTFSGFTLPSADESTSSSEDELDVE